MPIWHISTVVHCTLFCYYFPMITSFSLFAEICPSTKSRGLPKKKKLGVTRYRITQKLYIITLIVFDSISAYSHKTNCSNIEY